MRQHDWDYLLSGRGRQGRRGHLERASARRSGRRLWLVFGGRGRIGQGGGGAHGCDVSGRGRAIGGVGRREVRARPPLVAAVAAAPRRPRRTPHAPCARRRVLCVLYRLLQEWHRFWCRLRRRNCEPNDEVIRRRIYENLLFYSSYRTKTEFLLNPKVPFLLNRFINSS